MKVTGTRCIGNWTYSVTFDDGRSLTVFDSVVEPAPFAYWDGDDDAPEVEPEDLALACRALGLSS